MLFRKVKKTGDELSILGFGCMRLPTLGTTENIDEPEAVRMLRYSIDHGVNYVDTAYPYHGGTSETVVGKALKDGYREKVKVATKMPCWLVEKPEDLDRLFEEQLQRLGVDFIDFYLLHNLNKDHYQIMQNVDGFGWAEKKRDEGLIRHLGFSFHDEFPLFKRVIDEHDCWEFCKIQYNYMDIGYQAGREGLKYAAEKGLGIIIMEPLKGGQLALNPPPDPVKALWDKSGTSKSPAAWALQWIWNHPEVSLILSGMSTMEQVLENIQIAGESSAGMLDGEDLKLFDEVAETFRTLSPVPCTKCNYCIPCPEKVHIPWIFHLYNETQMYGTPDAARGAYRWLAPEKKADNCVECGQCEEKCPQNIEIIEWLKKAQEVLS